MEHIEPLESDYNAVQIQSSADQHLFVVDNDYSDPLLVNGQRGVPVNLRQSADSGARIAISTRIRKSPYWHLSQRHGCYAYEVYNHMYHPRAYVKPEDGGLLKEYEYLTNDVTLWNVAVERQIQIKGPDALAFANLLVTRDLTDKCKVNQARYVILCNEHGGINNPVLLRVAEDEIWLSISDSDGCCGRRALTTRPATTCRSPNWMWRRCRFRGRGPKRSCRNSWATACWTSPITACGRPHSAAWT